MRCILFYTGSLHLLQDLTFEVQKRDFMAQELDSKQKKEWAKLLFLTTDQTQAEIAEKVGVARITIVRWAKEWEGLKLNFLQTREARIKSTLMQLNELDESIASREPGARYPTAKEADIRRKLTADLEALEQEASVRDIVNVSRGILDYIRGVDLEKAKMLSDYFDSYIQDRLKWVK